MAQLELIDETWIGIAADQVAPVIAESARWTSWCPDVALVLGEDRDREGIRWRIGPDGPMTGTAEIWLQSMKDGVVLHYFLRADRAAGAWSRRGLARARERQRRLARRAFWALKDELEARSAPEPGRVT